MWDEFNLPIRYGSDIELAKSIAVQTAQEVLSEYVAQSQSKWQEVVDNYYVEDAQVEPTLALTMTDNWIQFNLRYIVDYKKRRITKSVLNDKIGKAILETNGGVTLASATFKIVKIPMINVDGKDKNYDKLCSSI